MKMSPLRTNCWRPRSHTAAMSNPPLGLSGSTITVPLNSAARLGRLIRNRVVYGMPVQPDVAAGGHGDTTRMPLGVYS